MNTPVSKNLRIYIINGILYTFMLNLYSPFAVKFLERLGGTEFHISLFNALPGLVAVFTTLPGTLLLIKCENKKKMAAFFFLVSRILLLTFVFLPLLPTYVTPILFVILISLRNFPESVSQSALQSLSGDLFPSRLRSTAISIRSKLSIPASLVVTLASGFILSKLPTTQEGRMLIYQAFFLLSFIVGIAEVAVFMRLDYTGSTQSDKLSIKQALSGITKNKSFMRFTACSLVFYFGWQMGWPLFNIYQIINLKADEWWLSLISITGSIGMFAGYSFWNRLIKERGNLFTIAVATLVMAINPVLLAASPNLLVITVLNLIIGFFTAGTMTVLLNYLLEVTPEDSRVIYIGIYNTLVNISLTISPLVAHIVLKSTNIYIALIIDGALRLVGSMVFFAQLWYNRQRSRASGIQA